MHQKKLLHIRTTASSITRNRMLPKHTSYIFYLIPTVTISAEEAQIYKEESDTRKAQRRIQQKKQNEEESTGQDNSGQASSDQDSETTSAMQTRGSYTIRPGDTLYQISIENYGTMDKVADICRANGISENEIIYPGQIIVLP